MSVRNAQYTDAETAVAHFLNTLLVAVEIGTLGTGGPECAVNVGGRACTASAHAAQLQVSKIL